jgi:hypothetical protein
MDVVNLLAEDVPMTLALWLRLVRRWLSARRAPGCRRTSRPALEFLEDRWLPSNIVLTVNDNRDVLDNPAKVTVGTLIWGDGSTSTVSASGIVALGGGNFAVRAAHTYALSGSYLLGVQLLDDGGASISGSQTIDVADAALANLQVQSPHATAGHDTGTFTVATFHDQNLGAPTSDFTAVIHWGDGSTTTLTSSALVSEGKGNFAVLASHLYGAAGTLTLSVRVDDFGGSSVAASLKITVA